MADIRIDEAIEAVAVASVGALMRAYHKEIGVDLCFQGFDRELAELPGGYAPPDGGLWRATVDGRAAGCVGLRPLVPGEAEIKRLYIVPRHRGLGLGRRLMDTALARAREAGFATVRLDTMRDKMDAAEALYRSQGFTETPAYTVNPLPGIVYYALDLSPSQ